MEVTLEAGSIAPAKEAGLRIDLIGFDLIFYLNTESGEIAALGTVAQPYSFTAIQGVTYQVGQAVRMGMTYSPPQYANDPLITPGYIEYAIDLGSGALVSPPIAFENTEGGILEGSIDAAYEQAAGDLANPEDFVRATFRDFDVQVESDSAFIADFDNDSDVDGGDFLTWQRHDGLQQGGAQMDGDANGDGAVSLPDLRIWGSQFGDLQSRISRSRNLAGWRYMIAVVSCLTATVQRELSPYWTLK